MIIKSVHDVVQPTHDKATGKMSVFTDTSEMPVAIRFMNKGEIADITKTLINMLASDDDNIITIKPNKLELDKAEFVKDFQTTKQEADVIPFEKPELPTGKPMKKGEE